MSVPTELDVLRVVSQRLEAIGCRYMLTGSFALAYYATPRMTRDLDFVVELDVSHVLPLVEAFGSDFYLDEDAVRQAIATSRIFNLLHLPSGIKVDAILRKPEPYRRVEFERRARVELGDFSTWIVSREDLILSKLVWSRDTASEMQRRDVVSLLAGPVDREYIEQWARTLGVADILQGLK